MSFRTWKRGLRDLWRSIITGRKPSARPCRPVRAYRSRPSLEVLEGRIVPANLLVNSLADNLTAGDSLVTLREAVVAANTFTTTDLGQTGTGNDTITFDPSLTAGGPATITLTGGELFIDSVTGLTIAGPGAGLLTLNNTNPSARIFEIVSSGSDGVPVTITISGLTISGGRGGNGGAILLSNGNSNTVLNLVASVFTDNRSSGQGGVLEAGGAGIAGTINISDCMFIDNSSAIVGGVIDSPGLNLNISGSTFASNQASGRGGALAIGSVNMVTIVNSTFSGNTSQTGDGGAIDSQFGAAFTIVNCTFTGNSAPQGPGGAIFNTSTMTLANTIVAGNSAASGSDIAGSITSQGGNLIQDTSGVSINGPATGDIYGVNPLLGPLADNGGPTATHALQSGSQAINAGNNALAVDPANASTPLTTDQRGFARIVDGTVDIGAYENPQSSTTTVLTATPNPVPFGRSVTLTATITSGGSPVTAGAVNFFISFESASTLLASNVPLDALGRAVFTTDLPSSSFAASSILAQYSGTSDFAASSAALDLSVRTDFNVSGAPTVIANTPYTLNLNSNPPGTATITSWTINWGDGAVDVLSGNPSTATHTYTEAPNAYEIKAFATTMEYGLVQASNTPLVQVLTSDVATSSAGTLDRNGTLTLDIDGSIGINATLTSGTGERRELTLFIAIYKDDPVDEPDVDIGAFYDVRVSNTLNGEPLVFAAGDTLIVIFEFPDGRSGDTLMFYDAVAGRYVPVVSSKLPPGVTVPPSFDGSIVVVFTSTSTPAITALSGTVFTVPLDPVLAATTPVATITTTITPATAAVVNTSFTSSTSISATRSDTARDTSSSARTVTFQTSSQLTLSLTPNQDSRAVGDRSAQSGNSASVGSAEEQQQAAEVLRALMQILRGLEFFLPVSTSDASQTNELGVPAIRVADGESGNPEAEPQSCIDSTAVNAFAGTGAAGYEPAEASPEVLDAVLAELDFEPQGPDFRGLKDFESLEFPTGTDERNRPNEWWTAFALGVTGCGLGSFVCRRERARPRRRDQGAWSNWLEEQSCRANQTTHP